MYRDLNKKFKYVIYWKTNIIQSVYFHFRHYKLEFKMFDWIMS